MGQGAESYHIITDTLHWQNSQVSQTTMPIDLSINLEFEEEEHDRSIDNQASGTYVKVIGSLMYAAIGTWPDITYAVHMLAKFMRSPQPRHWTAIKHVFWYLKGTCTHMLTYSGSDQEWKPELSMYCDAVRVNFNANDCKFLAKEGTPWHLHIWSLNLVHICPHFGWSPFTTSLSAV